MINRPTDQWPMGFLIYTCSLVIENCSVVLFICSTVFLFNFHSGRSIMIIKKESVMMVTGKRGYGFSSLPLIHRHEEMWIKLKISCTSITLWSKKLWTVLTPNMPCRHWTAYSILQFLKVLIFKRTLVFQIPAMPVLSARSVTKTLSIPWKKRAGENRQFIFSVPWLISSIKPFKTEEQKNRQMSNRESIGHSTPNGIWRVYFMATHHLQRWGMLMDLGGEWSWPSTANQASKNRRCR